MLAPPLTGAGAPLGGRAPQVENPCSNRPVCLCVFSGFTNCMRESVNLSSWPCQEKWAFWIVLLFCLEEYRHDCIFWATASSCFGFCFLALSKSCSISLPDPVLKLLQVVFTLNLIYLILLLHCRSFITFYYLALNRSMFTPTCTSVSPVDSCLPRHLGSNDWEVSDKNRKLCFILFCIPLFLIRVL